MGRQHSGVITYFGKMIAWMKQIKKKTQRVQATYPPKRSSTFLEYWEINKKDIPSDLDSVRNNQTFQFSGELLYHQTWTFFSRSGVWKVSQNFLTWSFLSWSMLRASIARLRNSSTSSSGVSVTQRLWDTWNKSLWGWSGTEEWGYDRQEDSGLIQY